MRNGAAVQKGSPVKVGLILIGGQGHRVGVDLTSSFEYETRVSSMNFEFRV